MKKNWDQEPNGKERPDEEFMQSLYREHAGPLHNYVLGMVGGDRHRAEDVVQETLVRAWRNASQLDPEKRPVRPWLITVARRIVIDGYRNRQARPQEIDSSPLELMPAEDEMEKALSLTVITEAMSAISEAHREALVETYIKGHTLNEAAAILGVPSGTVKSRIFYGLRSLKLALEERGVTG